VPGLTLDQARAKKREYWRSELAEIGHTKRKKSKYLSPRIGWPAILSFLAGAIVLMVVLLSVVHVREEWFFPILFLYTGVFLTAMAVQPWVRETPHFWISVLVGCGPLFAVGHWLAARHPTHTNAGVKGSGFLSLLAGYLIGIPVSGAFEGNTA
jgi:hypothetical protein